jgi:hypothetical protein
MAARVDTALAGALFALAVGLAIVGVVGPFLSGVIDYHVSESLLNQTIGLDAISLLAVAPLSLVAGVLVLRAHIAGPALALGIGTYTAYMFVQYIVGPEYLARPGNNELLFPIYLVLFTLGWGVAFLAWKALGRTRLPRSHRRERVIGRVVLPLLAFVAFFRYVPALADAMSAAPEDPGYRAGPTFFWAIAMMDLGVFLPLTAATCFGLVRGTAWAQRALYAVVGWFGLVGPAVAAMAITMYLRDDPNASGGNAVFMTVLGLAFALLAIVLYRPLFGSRS